MYCSAIEITLGQLLNNPSRKLWDNRETTFRQFEINQKNIFGQFRNTLRQLFTTLRQIWQNFEKTVRQLWHNSEKTFRQFEISVGQVRNFFLTISQYEGINLRQLMTISRKLWGNFGVTCWLLSHHIGGGYLCPVGSIWSFLLSCWTVKHVALDKELLISITLNCWCSMLVITFKCK